MSKPSKEYLARYRERNREKIRARQRDWVARKYATDPGYRMMRKLRAAGLKGAELQEALGS